MSLKDIFCQGRAIGSLQRAMAADKLAHAYIFAGADGVGKFTTARQWSKMLLCDDRGEEKTKDGVFYDSCGKCRSCTVFEGDGHPDFKVIYKELIKFTRDGKGRTTPVDLPINVIREFLIEKAASRPMMNQRTVYVVRQAERLNNTSQNALLKVLEEPASHCFIILLSSKLEKMLPTTRSRCQVIRFGPVDKETITAKLIETGTAGKEAAYWAGFSNGSIGSAMAWAGLEMEEESCYEIKKELIKKLADHRLADSVDLAEWIGGKAKQISQACFNRDKSVSRTEINRWAQKGLIEMMTAAFSDVMKLNIGDSERIVNSDQMARIKALAGKYTAEAAAECVAKGYENMLWVDRSVNEKLVFEELLLNYANSGIIRSSA